jgi:hypothetical protein
MAGSEQRVRRDAIPAAVAQRAQAALHARRTARGGLL